MTLSRTLKKLLLLLFFISPGFSQKVSYYGVQLGSFQAFSNDIKGEVFVTDDRTLFIKDFSYDGKSADAVFWAGSTENPDATGFIIPNEVSLLKPLPPQRNENILLRLQEDQNLKQMRWLSVWNRNESKSLGSLILSNAILPPHPMAIGPLVNSRKGIASGDILIIDSQTILVTDFSYDGSERELYWWLSKGTKPSKSGIPLLENESIKQIEKSQNRTIEITLPDGESITEYDTLSVWSMDENEDYGFVDVPKNLNIPPSPRYLGKQIPKMDEFNCEMLNDNLGLELRWLIKDDDIIMHLVGNIDSSEYMAVGISKDDTETHFNAADAVVAGVHHDGTGYALDYYFESRKKCEDGHGMCPDTDVGETDNLDLLQTDRGVKSTVISFKRPLRADDKVYDQNIYTDGPQAILWAIGPVDSDGSIDVPTLQSRGNLLLDFGRDPSWNCPPPTPITPKASSSKPITQHIHCPGDRSFRAQIGSSSYNNDHKVWFINGLPAPRLTVQRGNSYTFTVEGGLGYPIHHPFYITSSKEGGLFRNIVEENSVTEQTFAGIGEDPDTGLNYPTAEGRLCDWNYSERNPKHSVTVDNKNVEPTLHLKCEPGQPGKFVWTPTADTPDIIYYQSFMDKNIGGEIHVVGFCEETSPINYLQNVSKHDAIESQDLHTMKRAKLDLETENEDKEIFTDSLEKGQLNPETDEEKEEYFFEENPAESLENNFQPPDSQYTVSTNFVNVQRVAQNVIRENTNDKISLRNNNASPLPDSSKPAKVIGSQFPHDESERSDIYLPHHMRRNRINLHRVHLNPHRVPNFAPGKENRDRKTSEHVPELSNIPVLNPHPRHEFKPHFEGGFMPLVMNPAQEQEHIHPKALIYQSQSRNRPYRPFLYNESVPFHGTFKPGVPDFSGFNISHYSQDDASVILSSSQENLSILPPSKAQPLPRQLPPIGAIPLHLLQHHGSQPHRPQESGLRHQQHNPLFNGQRKNVFPRFSVNKPNLAIHNDDELVGVPSQRIYMTLQATSNKKPSIGNAPNRQFPFIRQNSNTSPNQHAYPNSNPSPNPHDNPSSNPSPNIHSNPSPNMHSNPSPNMHPNPSPNMHPNPSPNMHPNPSPNMHPNPSPNMHPNPSPNMHPNPSPNMHSNPSPNMHPNPSPNMHSNISPTLNPQKGIHPQSIQRRPDFYEGRESNHKNVPYRKFKPQGISLNVNKPNLHMMNLQPHQNILNGQFLNRPRLTGSNIPFRTGISKQPDQIRMKPGQTNQHLSLQMPSKENIHQATALTKGIQIHHLDKNLNFKDMLLKMQQNGDRLILPFPVSTNVENQGETQEKENSHESYISSVEEGRNLPQLIDAELVEVSDMPVNEKFSNDYIKQNHNLNMPNGVPNKNTISNSNINLPGSNQQNLPVEKPLNLSSNQIKQLLNIAETETVSIGSYSQVPPQPNLGINPGNNDRIHNQHDKNRPSQERQPADYQRSGNHNRPNIKPSEKPIPVDRVNNQQFAESEAPVQPQYGFDVPFGARLKLTQNGTTVAIQIPKEVRPSSVIRKTQLGVFNVPSTTKPPKPTPTGKTVAIIQNVTSSESSPDQKLANNKIESVKNLYYTPPLSSISVVPQHNYGSSASKQSPEEGVKHIPIIADSLEGLLETKNLGRKNILPNSEHTSNPAFVLLPETIDNINLPQISENLPANDNGTHYSILNHIMTLIGPSEST